MAEKKNAALDKLAVIEGEIAGFEIDPRGYHYPPGAQFKNCNVIISKDGKEIKLEYLLVPDALIDELKNIGDMVTIYYIKENVGGFIFAVKNNGKIREDINGALKARETAIYIGSMTFPQFRRTFGKPDYYKNNTSSAIGKYAHIFDDIYGTRFFLSIFQMFIIGMSGFFLSYLILSQFGILDLHDESKDWPLLFVGTFWGWAAYRLGMIVRGRRVVRRAGNAPSAPEIRKWLERKI